MFCDISRSRKALTPSISEGDLKRRAEEVKIPHLIPAENLKLGTAIERGSFGVVRRARWLRSIVAVKVLPTVKPTQLMAFMREMAFACGLRHPNIVATMGAVTDKYCALVMELMPWGSLKASLNDQRRRIYFNPLKMKRGMMSICRAGAYLASVSVIHRDISSKNVFVTAEFDGMKLGDFGLSSLLEQHLVDRQDPHYGNRLGDHLQIFAGAPPYKAPELLSARPKYSEASDVFAFAIVAWEMITTLWSGTYGRPWSDIQEQHALEAAIMRGHRPPLDPNSYGLSEDQSPMYDPLLALVKDCWHPKAPERPTFLVAHDRIKKSIPDATPAIEHAPTPTDTFDKQDTADH